MHHKFSFGTRENNFSFGHRFKRIVSLIMRINLIQNNMCIIVQVYIFIVRNVFCDNNFNFIAKLIFNFC